MEPLNENMAAFNLTINHSIPEDLVLRILSKLPIKSLKRFQCVQKSWNNLLDDPHFVKMYYENLMSKSENCDSCIFLKQEIPNTDQHNMFFLSGERYENKMKLDLPPTVQDNECFKVLGSCVNGIICLVPYGPEFNDTRNVVFWNPTTNEFKGIPPDLAVMLNYYFYISYKGFGYDSLRDDYILIRIGQYSDIGGRYDGVEEDEPSDFFETYYPNGQLRRQISDYLLDEDGRDLIDFAIYLNGTCHWRSRLQKDPYVDRSGTYKSHLSTHCSP